MSGIIYGRAIEDDSDSDIHLWKINGDLLETYCGEYSYEIVDTASSSVLALSESGVKTEFLVTQKESLKHNTEGYCDDCVASCPKV